VIVREPVDVVVERENAGGGANAGLAHRAAKALLPAPDLVDEIARAGDHGADRRTEPFREIDPGGIPTRGHVARGNARGDAGVHEPRAIHVGGEAAGSGDFHDVIEIRFVPDRAAADIGGLFDADDGLRRLVTRARVKRCAKSIGRKFSVGAL